MARFNRKEALRNEARKLGLHIATYSPRDGVTRYRFFKSKKSISYFSADGIYTALGIKEAETFLAGYRRRR